MAKIKTTGDLREFLCSSINLVANGTMDPQKARDITKIAAQVNESFYAEVKVIKTKIDMGHEFDRLGSLSVADSDK